MREGKKGRGCNDFCLLPFFDFIPLLSWPVQINFQVLSDVF